MVLLIVLSCAGGHGVFEEGEGSARVGEGGRFCMGNPSSRWGEWCVWAGEIVGLRKKTLFETEMCCHLMP